MRDSKPENWNWIEVKEYVTEPGIRRTQDEDGEGDREREFGSDRKEKVKFGEMVRECQCPFGSAFWTDTVTEIITTLCCEQADVKPIGKVHVSCF